MANEFWQTSRLSFRITSPTGDETTLEVGKPYAIAGSNETCDVVINDRNVSRRSLLFLVTSRGVRCVVLSDASKNAGRTLRVDPDKPIRIGKHSLSVRRASGPADDLGAKPTASRLDGDADDDLEATPLQLLTWSTDGLRRFVRLHEESPLVIGRKSPAHLRIDDERLSGVHCCLFRKGQALWVIDLNSGNGTFVGGKNVTCSVVADGRSFVAGAQRIHWTRLHPSGVVEQLEQEHQNIAADRDAERLRSTELEQQLHETQTTLGSTQDALAASEAKLRASQSQLEHAQLRAERADSTNEALLVELSEHMTATGVLQTQMDKLLAEGEEAKRQLAECRREFAELESRFADERQGFEATRIELSQAMHSLRDAEENHRSIESVYEQAVGELKETRSDREAAEATVSELRDENKALRSQVEELSAQLERTKQLVESDALRARESELDRLKSELATEREILGKLKLDTYTGAPSDEIQQTRSFVEDDTCIASFDFQEILEEAMEDLPSIEEQA